MGILLIDSSSKKAEFGFANNNSEEIIIKEELDPGQNADTLVYFMKKVFDGKSISFGEIEFVSLSNGPGSFTGLRIGSAIAKGICFALGCKLIEIPTLDIIANKYKSEFSASNKYPDEKIISLVFSNSKTREFYYCVYEFNHSTGNLNTVSDFKIDSIENILAVEGILLINEKENGFNNEDFRAKITDVSGKSSLDTQYILTKEMIQKKIFVDYKTSEPFYVKEFVPKLH